MQFREKKAIYIQIADMIADTILSGRWKEGDRVPSVRELAVTMEVNPNTAARTYSYLQEQGIIKNKRGIGYFVSPEGVRRALDVKREDFLTNELPRFFRTLKILGLADKTIESLRQEFLSKESGYKKG